MEIRANECYFALGQHSSLESDRHCAPCASLTLAQSLCPEVGWHGFSSEPSCTTRHSFTLSFLFLSLTLKIDGWLWKKGEKGVFKSFRKRFFRVVDDAILYAEVAFPSSLPTIPLCSFPYRGPNS